MYFKGQKSRVVQIVGSLQRTFFHCEKFVQVADFHFGKVEVQSSEKKLNSSFSELALPICTRLHLHRAPLTRTDCTYRITKRDGCQSARCMQ